MAAARQSILDDFKAGLRELNAQFWLLSSLTTHGTGLAKSVKPLDGLPFTKSLQVLLPHSRAYWSRIRLRNRHMSSDLETLCTEAENWLPAYFLVLGKSLAEGTIHALIEHSRIRDPALQTRFQAFRAGRKISVTKAVEVLAAAAARGDFGTVLPVLWLRSREAQLKRLAPDLKKYNQTRNRLAHRLGEQMATGPGVSHSALTAYFGTLMTLITTLVEVI